MNLSKFANIFKLDVSKGIFPYEFFKDMKELEETVTWPTYLSFQSSLPAKEENFVSEIDEILNLPVIYGFKYFGELLENLEIRLNLTQNEHYSASMPNLSEDQSESLKNQLFMSPKIYLEEKFTFEGKIKRGVFKNFVDHLVYYNVKDYK